MFRCHFCLNCDSRGCRGELPGMGGVLDGENFLLNCRDWKELYNENKKDEIDEISISKKDIGCAPVTGAKENIGFEREEDFYPLYIGGAAAAGIFVCVGDGCPDEKLKLGIKAVTDKKISNATYFFKPYPEDKLFERAKWLGEAGAVGLDIDAYNIVTMREKVHLEKKSAQQLKDFRRETKRPLAIKGVFTESDITLCREVLPEIIVISNHGGRVETRVGSSARFLSHYGRTLAAYCKEVWVDGGVRCARDLRVAKYFGAARVLLGRPFVSAVCKDGAGGIGALVEQLTK